MKVTVFIAASLDGYIAREDGDVSWLHDPAHIDEGVDYGFNALLAGVDALVMGRKSFEKVLTFGDWPYGETCVIVLSSRGVEIPASLHDHVESASQAPTDLCDTLARRGVNHLYIDGGLTVRNFLRDGLVTDLVITRIPRLLGKGVPLFGALDAEAPLRHVSTTAYPKGLVMSHYRIGSADTTMTS
ncbi:MAG TPA: dihydrofolate reductase family protein [Phycisphaerae bacterium]|nr:dihydrofolate reductase family protein [Phycisphaerae bacterium]HRW55770.1 dihydrofolate reductase family protein [Phycisphaerae bacterium]